MKRFPVLFIFIFSLISFLGCTKETEVIYIQREDSANVHEYVPDDFKSTILADDDDLLVKITSLYQDEIWGVIAEGYIKNNTESDVNITLLNLLINDKETDPIELGAVTPEEKKKFIIEWDYNQLENLNINKIDDISFKFEASENKEDIKADNKGDNNTNKKSKNFKDFNSTDYHIYPYQNND